MAPEHEQSAAPAVSVVVPARNAAATIDAQLDALAHQHYPGRIEVVVVDNGSTDDTPERAAAWAARLPVLRVVDASDRQGPAHARNAGFAAATGDLVLMCDADDVVDASWVGRMTAALADADAVAGGSVPWGGGPLPRGARPAGFGAGFGFLPAFSSSSAAVRRAAWEAVGGFDEDLPMCEDLDLAWRLQQAGYRLASQPDAFVYYREPSDAVGVLHKWFRYGMFQARLFAKHRSAGLRAEPPAKAAARWALLVLTSYRLLGAAPARRAWCREAGRRAGRLVGSLRERVLFL